MQQVRSKTFIRFLISILLAGLVGGLFLSSRKASSQGSPVLSDDFNDNLLDTAKWNPNSLFSGFIDLNIPITETGQRLEIGPLLQNTPDSHYRGIRSVNTYNFSGAYSYVELAQPPSSATSADAMFTVGNDVNNYYRLYTNAGTLYGLRKVGGTKTTLFSLPYDAVNHRFLRIRHDAATGNVTLDTAPASGEAPANWVQRYSEVWNASISLTAMIFELKGGTWQLEANAPGKVIFDNFRLGSNIGSPPTVTAISPNSGTINGGTVVNITGSKFAAGATVSLGGSLATNVTVLSSSSIIATTSAHSAGTVNVLVTNADGQSGTLANGYTYSSAPPPQVGLLSDDFNDNLLDTAKWNPNSLFSGFIDLNIPITETGQRLEIGPLLQNTPDSHYRGIRSVNTYNFSGAYSYVELAQPSSSATSADAMFTVGNDVNNYYRLFVSAGTLYGLRKVGGTKTTLFSLPYDAVNHRFLRIRHDAATGNVTLDTAPGSGEAPTNWVQRYSEVWNASISLTAMIFELKGGTWQLEANAPGKVIFDNFRAAVPGAGGGLSLPPLAALRDPLNRTGGTGENPLSRNFNFGVPLLGLPGRAGLDLTLSLAYNSLVWLNTGSAMSFDQDAGFPSPGFRLGFPAMQVYTNPETFKNSFLLLSPDGSRTEFRRVGTSALYESTDSNYALLDTNTMTLRTADGTQFTFALIGSIWQCTQIKDRNGNYITINYTGFGRIETILDTLRRTITFNYNSSQQLTSITQTWTINGQPQTHTWASFAYADVTFQTNFPDLFITGPANGSTRKMLTEVTINDGSRFNFEYTSWGQVWKIRNHAPDGHLLNYRSYDLPQTNAVALQDCPRFKERRDWAENWNRSGAPGPTGLPAGPEQEVITRYEVPTSVSWTPPNGSLESGRLAKVTAPDGTYNKIYFAGAEASSAWRGGLPALVETYDSANELQRQVVTTWTQDTSVSLEYEVNPRIIETNTYDPTGNRVRVVVAYQTINIGDGTSCKLPQNVYEYQANASTVLRRTHTKYALTTPYTTRRIIGLQSEKSLYEVDPDTLNETLMSKLEFYYDESAIQGAADPAATQHDNANFGVNFLVGRANLTTVRRYDVQNTTQFTTTTNKYNRAGSLVSSKDALDNEVTLSYTDAFATNAAPLDPDPLDAPRLFTTLAYPTTINDPDGYSTKFRYNYDFGARAWQQTPQPNVTTNTPGPVQTFTYDVIGRLTRTTSLANNAFIRYNYGPNYIETFSSINSTVETANEGHRLQVYDGVGRTIVTAGDHPNSTGGFSAQIILYDRMGRLQKRSNPTETTISVTGGPINPSQFAPLGDDATANGGFGWKYMEQTYDWKARPLVTTNQDGTTKIAEYTGCGCAGGEVVTLTDEGTINNGMPKRRQQKIYSDVLGRTVKAEILNWQNGTPYSTTVNTYNARDQKTLSRQFAGIEGSGTYQDTTMSYDGYGRLSSRHVPEQQVGTATVWTYNADDTVNTITDARGATTTFGYAGIKRHLVKTITHTLTGSPTINVSYNYDAAGNRTSMTDGLGSVTYAYNQLSQLMSETRGFNGVGSFTINYDYNFAGQLSSITDPFGASITYQRDAQGQLKTVTGSPYAGITDYVTDVNYRAWGAPKNVDYPGSNSTIAYNTRLQPTQFRLLRDNGSSIMREDYSYYADGRVSALIDLDDTAGSNPPVSLRFLSRAYNYDHAGRVTGGFGTGNAGQGVPYEQNYSYDEFGNMTGRSGSYYNYNFLGPIIDTATYTNNRRSNWNHNFEGQVTSTTLTSTDRPRTMNYDAAGRMVSSVETGQFNTVTYTASYDGDDEVIYESSTTSPGTSESSYVLRSTVLGGEVLTRLDQSGNKRITHVPAEGLVFATQRASGAPGSFVLMTQRNPLGITETTKAVYDPLGNYIPFQAHGEPKPPAGSYTSASMSGLSASLANPHSYGTGCLLDGSPIGCSLAMRLQNNGSAQRCPQNDCGPRIVNGQLTPLSLFQDGFGVWVKKKQKPPTLKKTLPSEREARKKLIKERGRNPYGAGAEEHAKFNLDVIRTLVTTALQDPVCRTFYTTILQSVSSKNNPALENGDLLAIFERFLKEGQFTREAPGGVDLPAHGYADGLIGGPKPATISIIDRYGDRNFLDAYFTIGELFHLSGSKDLYYDKDLAVAVHNSSYSSYESELTPEANIFSAKYARGNDETDVEAYSYYFHTIHQKICIVKRTAGFAEYH